ncbi:MAG: hypothetical protein R3Y28_04245 [Candidatus Gastranaerophilales bacterium]
MSINTTNSNQNIKTIKKIQTTPLTKSTPAFKGELKNDSFTLSKFVDNGNNPTPEQNPNNTKTTGKAKTIIATGLATASVLGAIAISRGQKLSATITKLKSDNYFLQREMKSYDESFATRVKEKVSDAVKNAILEEKHANKAEIDELKERFSKYMEIPENAQKYKDELVEKYSKAVKEAGLDYDPLKPSLTSDKLEKPYWARTLFEIKDIPPKPITKLENPIDLAQLKSKLHSDGNIDIEIPKVNYKKSVTDGDVSIAGRDVPDLGKPIETDFKLAYGERTDWSDEKIARDIMQNFYDGHGNTLEGVKIKMEKSGESYKVRISGDALFEHENLRYLGSGNKLENPYNAGGFGEGSRVVVASLLGKGDSNAVKFASSDWELLFDAQNGIMRRTISKAENKIDGNYIEFETTNKHFVDSILDSTEYFAHPNNKDFSNLTFENKAFGFKFLPDSEKGNIYLTQRFEYGEQGQWAEGVDNLRLIFKRKPDPERFELITGKKFNVGRDRLLLTNDDVENLTKYFARDMSDQELMDAVLSTKSQWEKLPLDSKQHPLKSFIKALSSETKARGLALDASSEKYITIGYADMSIIDILKSYGYKLCPKEFENLGFHDANSVYKSLSNHIPLKPTNTEIQKMKVLEEASARIQESLETTFKKKVEEIIKTFDIDIIEKALPNELNNRAIDILATVDQELYLKVSKGKWCFDYNSLVKGLTPEEIAEVNTAIMGKIKADFKNLAVDSHSEDSVNLLKLLKLIKKDENIDEYTKRQIMSLDNLQIITKEDATRPRFIFDRKNEIKTNTLGESMVQNNKYLGHWIDREYLSKTDFAELLSTWLHEICHKHGGDGTSEFTYKLTDLISGLLDSSVKDSKLGVELKALEEVFNKIQ